MLDWLTTDDCGLTTDERTYALLRNPFNIASLSAIHFG